MSDGGILPFPASTLSLPALLHVHCRTTATQQIQLLPPENFIAVAAPANANSCQCNWKAANTSK